MFWVQLQTLFDDLDKVWVTTFVQRFEGGLPGLICVQFKAEEVLRHILRFDKINMAVLSNTDDLADLQKLIIFIDVLRSIN